MPRNKIKNEKGKTETTFPIVNDAQKQSSPPTFPFNYPQCNKTFQTNKNLRYHIKGVHNKDPIKCTECEVICRGPTALKDHRRKVHPPKKPGNLTTRNKNLQPPASFKCPNCDKTFQTNTNLRYHIKGVHNKDPIKCTECEVICRGPTALKDHRRNVHPAKKPGNLTTRNKNLQPAASFKCPTCDKTFPGHRHLWNHIKGVHNKDPIQCSKCELICRGPTALSDHMRKWHPHKKPRNVIIRRKKLYPPTSFKCPHCGKTFSARKNLWNHIRVVHYKDPVECTVCGVTCSNITVLNDHRRNAHKNESIQCHICYKLFQSKRYLRGHLRDVHEKPKLVKRVRVPVECPICFKMLSNRSTFSSHYRSSHGNCGLNMEFNECKGSKLWNFKFPFTCALCQQTFQDWVPLLHHLCQCKGKISLYAKCVLCDRRTLQLDYALHVQGGILRKFFQGLQQFSCKFCPLVFPDEKSLVSHESLHNLLYLLNPKPDASSILDTSQFVCSSCFYTTETCSQMMCHNRTHHGVKIPSAATEREDQPCSDHADSNVKFFCYICMKGLCSRYAARLHVQDCEKFLENSSEPDFTESPPMEICTKCSFQTAYQTVLRIHDIEEHGETKVVKRSGKKLKLDPILTDTLPIFHCEWCGLDLHCQSASNLHAVDCEHFFGEFQQSATSVNASLPLETCRECSFQTPYPTVLANHTKEEHTGKIIQRSKRRTIPNKISQGNVASSAPPLNLSIASTTPPAYVQEAAVPANAEEIGKEFTEDKFPTPRLRLHIAI